MYPDLTGHRMAVINAASLVDMLTAVSQRGTGHPSDGGAAHAVLSAEPGRRTFKKPRGPSEPAGKLRTNGAGVPLGLGNGNKGFNPMPEAKRGRLDPALPHAEHSVVRRVAELVVVLGNGQAKARGPRAPFAGSFRSGIRNIRAHLAIGRIN